MGIYLAQKLRGEVISADSRQVYKGLDIGTGKVTKKEMAGVKHHLLSVVSPKKQFTVNDFVIQAEKICSGILQNNRIPIVVGGTGLYVDMLTGRMSYPEVPPNLALRKAQKGRRGPRRSYRPAQPAPPGARARDCQSNRQVPGPEPCAQVRRTMAGAQSQSKKVKAKYPYS